MEFEFVIPELRAELLRGGRVKQYTVAELLSPALLRAPLDEFQSVFRTQGPLAILDHFDVLYGVLCHFKSLDASLQEQTLDLVMKVVSQHSSILPSVLGSSPPAPLLRQQHLNTLKMGCYLLTQLVEAFEERGARMQTLNLAAGGKARRPKASSLSVDWETDRVSSLQHLTQLLQLDLWPLGPPDAALTRIVTRCCYRLLESPAVVHVKNKPVREAVAHLLALMIRRYNHMLGATLNIIQLLQHFEHVAPALVHIVSIWANEYGLKTIVGEILREIHLTVDNSGGSETLGVRAIAAFLSELAEEIPTAILPNVSLILDLLNKESAALRSGVLCCLSHMVCRSLSGPGLDADSRRLRDAFLDLLSQHLHDSNALVRSRALQLLTAVVRGKALPLKRFQPLVTLATGRLCDKAVNVCKNAVNLLAAILANNPFCGRLSIDELSLSHQKELKKLLVLRAERGTAAGVPLTPREEWEAILPELLPALQATLEDGETEEQEGETETEGGTAVRGEIGDTPQALCEEVRTLLKAARYRQASLLALEGLSSFPDAFPFRTPTSDPQDGEGVTDDETTLLRILQACLRGAGTEQEEEGDSKVPEPEVDEGTSELARQEVLVQYLHDTLTFGEAIQSAIEIIGKLLASKNPSVVQDAIHFFVSIAEFDVPGSMAGMKQMLPLVCSKEPGVREAVVDAYRQLYLNPNGKRPKPLVLVQNLTALIFDASVERIKCLEELVSEFVRQQEVEGSVIQLLWERFTGKVAATADERRAAVILLGMAARGEAEIVGSNLETLFTVGLGPRAAENYQLARDVCMTIGKITHTKKGLPGQREASFRLPSDHPLFSSISTAITEGFSTPSLGWRPFAEAALSLVYRLAETPDRLSGRLLVQCSRLLLSPNPVSASSPPGSPQSNGTTGQVPSHLLANLVCLVGHVALQQVVHLEQSVAPEMQRRRLEREQRSSKQRTANTSKRGSVSAMEEELGLVEGSVEDTEADLVRRICDGELLEEGQLLAAFVPLVVRLCSNPGAYEDSDLATISCLALCKLTFVSYDFCERNLRLLFTLLEKSPTPTIRCNTMVALGDLCFRFPNLLEPWSPSLYSRLRDPSRSVRRTALIVMTHLILRDMVKVKGQISEIAVLLVDEDEEISLLARSFFNELSCKGNAVYNLLPDIISRLSDAECGIEEEPFHAVMRLTFGYITKDRQTESLVEKLCQRFRTATLDRQYRDLAFCLGLLPASERGLRKIQDNFDCISDKLQQDYVYQQFQNLVGRLRRALRPELKVLVDEFEQRICRCHSRGLDEGDSIDVKPAQPPKAVGKGTAGKKMSSAAVVSATPRVGRRNKPRRKVCVEFSSDEDDDEDDEDAAVMDCDTPVLSPIRRSGQRRGPRARK